MRVSTRMFTVRILNARYKTLCAAAFGLFLPATAAVAEVLTLLTLDGDLRVVEEVPQPRLRRIAATEGGFNVVVDDYGVLRDSEIGPVISFATDAFRINANHFAAVKRQLSFARQQASGSESAGSFRAERGSTAELSISKSTFHLLVRHQEQHPAGHNFTPTPRVQFLPQDVMDDQIEGQRGFAVIAVGESGRVMQVRVLTDDGPVRSPKLQMAIGNGTKTFFQDERRHDHTVYFAYEVRGRQVRQVGHPLVALPMCCGGCTGICP